MGGSLPQSGGVEVNTRRLRECAPAHRAHLEHEIRVGETSTSSSQHALAPTFVSPDTCAVVRLPRDVGETVASMFEQAAQVARPQVCRPLHKGLDGRERRERGGGAGACN